jgi:hypothetical protein
VPRRAGRRKWPIIFLALFAGPRCRYNRTARPFNWKFTADDLTTLLHRIGQREQVPASQQADLSQAA